MAIQRKMLKSIGEWSVFKYSLIAYLVFYIISVLFIIVIGLISLLFLPFSLFDPSSLFASMGMEVPAVLAGVSGIGLLIMVVIGLLFSVVIAVSAVIIIWIFNVILKISGGIELRFSMEQEPEIK